MTVYIVGAGPGDPGLLTVKAAQLCAKAEVVLYDRLVSEEILAMVAPWAERIPVGKDPDGRSVSQQEIHQLLIKYGSQNKVVVRLKGGDPFVFGRGAEEVDILAQQGIVAEVVPGITSAIAAPAAAGIPVTKRAVSSAFTVVTAHQDPEHDQLLNWDALASLGTTIVILMGAKRAKRIRKKLLTSGMSPEMPVAVICSATTPEQQVTRFPLADLGERAISNPAVIVVGEVAKSAESKSMSAMLYEVQGAKPWL